MRLEDHADLVVALLEDRKLLALLRDVAGIRERAAGEVLSDRRRAGDSGADVPRGLRLERLELLVRRALEREADESDAEAPDVVLLRRAVKLHGEDVPVEVGELGEQRLAVDALLVHEPEVRVVAHHDYALALRRGGAHGGDDLPGVLDRRGVACRVVGEVQYENLLLAWREKRLLHGRRVECAAPEGVEVDDPAADGLLEYELVVVPVEVRADERVGGPCKQLGAHADAVRERVRHDGGGEPLAV